MDPSIAGALVGVAGTVAGVGLTLLGQGMSEAQRRKREELARFHDDRRAVYSRFLAHLNTRRKYASDLSVYWDTPQFATVREAAPDEGEWLREAQGIMAEIHLLGDEEVIQSATGLLMASMSGPLVMFAPSATKPTREQVRERAAAAEKLFKGAYDPCLRAMRASMNVADPGSFHVV